MATESAAGARAFARFCRDMLGSLSAVVNSWVSALLIIVALISGVTITASLTEGWWWLVAALALLLLSAVGAGSRLEYEKRLDVVLEPCDPDPVNHDWNLDLIVRNNSAIARRLTVKVDELQGHRVPGPIPEWWVPWRHQAGARIYELPGESSERAHLARCDQVMLEMLGSLAIPAVGVVRFQISQTEDSPVLDHPAVLEIASLDQLFENKMSVGLKLIDADSGRVLTRRTLLIGFLEEEGLRPTVAWGA